MDGWIDRLLSNACVDGLISNGCALINGLKLHYGWMDRWMDGWIIKQCLWMD